MMWSGRGTGAKESSNELWKTRSLKTEAGKGNDELIRGDVEQLWQEAELRLKEVQTKEKRHNNNGRQINSNVQTTELKNKLIN